MESRRCPWPRPSVPDNSRLSDYVTEPEVPKKKLIRICLVSCILRKRAGQNHTTVRDHNTQLPRLLDSLCFAFRIVFSFSLQFFYTFVL